MFIAHSFINWSGSVKLNFQVCWLMLTSPFIIKSIETLFKLRETLVECTFLFFKAFNNMREIRILGTGLLSRGWNSHWQLTWVTESHVCCTLLPLLWHSWGSSIFSPWRKLQRWDHHSPCVRWRFLLLPNGRKSILGREIYHSLSPGMLSAGDIFSAWGLSSSWFLTLQSFLWWLFRYSLCPHRGWHPILISPQELSFSALAQRALISSAKGWLNERLRD